MALTTELLSALDNADEPLAKRLRIANNAFNSSDLPAFNKEGILLKWFSKVGSESDNPELWDSLHACLTSPHIRDLRQNEIKQNILTAMIKTIIKRLKQDIAQDLKKSILKCAIAILKNDNIFNPYFRFNMKQYCIFVSTVLSAIDNLNELVDIVAGSSLFNKKITAESDYSNNFLEHTFDAVVHILLKHNDAKLFECCTKLIQRAIFPYTSTQYKTYLTKLFEKPKKSKEIEPENLINKLKNIYESDSEHTRLGFKIIFIAFVIVHKNLLVYQFFVFLLKLLGFKIESKFNKTLLNFNINYNLEMSLLVLSELLETIRHENLPFDLTIHDVTFQDCIKSLLTSILRIQPEPTLSTLKIIKTIVVLDPILIDNTISEILSFIPLLKKDGELQTLYSNLMISIFDMYLRLHRIHKFCSELLRTLKGALLKELTPQEPDFKFQSEIIKKESFDQTITVRDIFPEDVVSYFHKCISMQSSKQVISIMRTLIIMLDEIVEDLPATNEDTKRVLYIQIVSDLTCQFLLAARIAEHTITELTVTKFLKDMDNLKDILMKFGTALLKMEHNHVLMYSFLNIAYVWAEVAIILMYYAPIENINFKETANTDKAASNITYLHSYLTTEQWSLVSQRIKNFGEQPCKIVLQKLITQKLRAMILFEPELDPRVEHSVVSNFSTNLEYCWDIIMTERFIVSTIIPKMQTTQLVVLAELIVNDILNKNSFDIIQQDDIIDCRDIVTSIFYVCLTKISNLCKIRKTSADAKLISTKIFKTIDQNSFVRSETIDFTKVAEFFSTDSNVVRDFKIDEEHFFALMEIIKRIPVYVLSHDIQTTFFLYLLGICVDFKNSTQDNNKVLEKCEEYLIGLVENSTSPNIFKYIPNNILVNTILNKVNRHKEILSFTINKALKNDDTIETFKSATKLLSKNISTDCYLETAIEAFHIINKANKYKISADSKDSLKKYKLKLCKSMIGNVLLDAKINGLKIEAYALTLQNYLNQDTDNNLSKLTAELGKYFDYIVKNIDDCNTVGSLLLFEIVLRHKPTLPNVPQDFILSAWKICKQMKITNDKHEESYNKTVSLLFEHVTNEQFPTILTDLLDAVVTCLKSEKMEDLTRQLKIWISMLNSALNVIKQKKMQQSLQTLMEHLILYLVNNSNPELNSSIAKLQISIIENKQVLQSPQLIDIYFQTIQIIMSKNYDKTSFPVAFETSFSIMEALIHHKKFLLIDRLPTYLLHFRMFLKQLCVQSNADFNLEQFEITKLADCAFRMDKLVKIVCTLKKDMARIAPYLIADILKKFEKITFVPQVKTHLNNCLYHLVELCDNHAVSYLLRALSPASTELFKTIHENYKKYYKFTGKV